MLDIYDEFDTENTLYTSPRFAGIKRRILRAIGKSVKGISIRAIKERLRLARRTDGIIYPALRELELDGKITNVAKKDISGETLGVSLYILGGKEMQKLKKVTKKQVSDKHAYVPAKKNIYPDLEL